MIFLRISHNKKNFGEPFFPYLAENFKKINVPFFAYLAEKLKKINAAFWKYFKILHGHHVARRKARKDFCVIAT
jgi:hypothetical protein